MTNLDLKTLNETGIQAWANENVERAKALGMRLISNQTAEALEALDSLGEDEDLIEAWAIAHPVRAKLLMMKLIPLFST